MPSVPLLNEAIALALSAFTAAIAFSNIAFASAAVPCAKAEVDTIIAALASAPNRSLRSIGFLLDVSVRVLWLMIVAWERRGIGGDVLETAGNIHFETACELAVASSGAN